MQARSPDVKNELTVRLRRIEGQVRGVLRMVEEDREWPEILQQMNAVRAALHQASLVAARDYAGRCLEDASPEQREAILDNLIAALGKLD